MGKQKLKLVLVCAVLSLGLNGCALLKVPLALVKVPFQLAGTAAKVAQASPVPPWMFF